MGKEFSKVTDGQKFKIAVSVMQRFGIRWSEVTYLMRNSEIFEVGGSQEPLDVSSWAQNLAVKIIDN